MSHSKYKTVHSFYKGSSSWSLKMEPINHFYLIISILAGSILGDPEKVPLLKNYLLHFYPFFYFLKNRKLEKFK